MSYLKTDNPDITTDINTRKEFALYKKEFRDYRYADEIIPRFVLDDLFKRGKVLEFTSYQLFVRNFMNPNTPYERLQVKWETGMGKTIASLAIAMAFINYYTKFQSETLEEMGTVYIIGFSERVFKNELLRFPELGFITREERVNLNKLRKLASTGSKKEMEQLREFVTKIKKRFGNRKGYGFFKFIGYKAFVNRIFKVVGDINISDLTEEEIYQNIKYGNIVVNKELLKTFENSLVICDEIHNVYNSIDKNNWGVAVQYVLDNVLSSRAVFMSATPLNNFPTEIVDLLNLLLPPGEKVHKDMFFNNKELKPGALEKIGKLVKGRVSFLRNVNPAFYPRRRFLGEKIKGVKYLKFIRCPMSKFQYNTYKQVYDGALSQDSQYLIDFALPNPNSDKIGLYQTRTIKKDINYATRQWKNENRIDFVEGRIVGTILKKETLKKYSMKYYTMMNDIHKLMVEDPGKLFIYHNIVHISGVLFIQEVLLNNGFIDEFGRSHENTLCVVCGKPRKQHKKEQLGGGDLRVIQDGVLYTIEKDDCYLIKFFMEDKVMVDAGFISYRSGRDDADLSRGLEIIESYNKPVEIKVHNECTDLLRILKSRGYTHSMGEEYSVMSLESTGKELHDITVDNEEEIIVEDLEDKIDSERDLSLEDKIGGIKNSHVFRPARFIVVHSEIDKSQMYQSLDKYNNPENADGKYFMTLVGSKMVKEAHDFKAIRHMYIMGRPNNIPTLRQITGRGNRMGSHVDLPQEKRTLDISIYTSSLPNGGLSYEELKYKEKLHYYEVIQNIERTFHENAIDSIANKDIIQTDVQDPYQSDPKEAIPHYNMLPYTPNVPKKFLTKKFTLNELNTSTFDIFYFSDEINIVTRIIKRLFLELSPVWKYDDLFKMVKNPPFNLEVNTDLFCKDLYNITLSRLIWNQPEGYTEPYYEQEQNFLDKMMNPNDKILMDVNGQKNVIVFLTEYYILFPLTRFNKPNIDINNPYRIMPQHESLRIDLQDYLSSEPTLFNYEEKRNKFHVKWKNVSIGDMEQAIKDFGFNFQLSFIEECIQYVYELLNGGKKNKTRHDFYLTMLYYYDTRGLIIWASTAKDFIQKLYPNVVKTSTKLILKKDKTISKEDWKKMELSTDHIINALKSSVNSSRSAWVPSEIISHFQASKNRFDAFVDSKEKKVPSDILPIGHIMDEVPKFFHPDKGGWFESPEYIDTVVNFKENNIIIGYDEKVKNSVNIRFKVRPPLQNITKSKDSRKIEKGSVCSSSKSKIFLKAISKKLGVEINPKMNVTSICDKIRRKLIYNELKERMDSKSRKKWFYFSYERQPYY